MTKYLFESDNDPIVIDSEQLEDIINNPVNILEKMSPKAKEAVLKAIKELKDND